MSQHTKYVGDSIADSTSTRLAHATGKEQVQTVADGRRYTRQDHKYQAHHERDFPAKSK